MAGTTCYLTCDWTSIEQHSHDSKHCHYGGTEEQQLVLGWSISYSLHDSQCDDRLILNDALMIPTVALGNRHNSILLVSVELCVQVVTVRVVAVTAIIALSSAVIPAVILHASASQPD